MNSGAATILAQSFLKGVFDVFDAMLSLSFKYDIGAVEACDEAGISDVLAQYPVVMRAKVKAGGAVALLFQVADASRFASLVLSEEASVEEASVKDTLGPEDIATLREIADPCVAGGVKALMEKLGRDAEQPEAVEVAVAAPDEVSGVIELLGASPTAVRLTFSAPPELDGTGVLLFAAETEALVPPDRATQPASQDSGSGLAADAQLSEAEMSDILSGFSPEEAPEGAPSTEPTEPSARGNIDRVLDIRLVAKARLGSVRMSIGDILALGPGSIIEVGHMVDEPVEFLVNDKLVARGDVVVVDEKFGIRITEIVSPEERIESLH